MSSPVEVRGPVTRVVAFEDRAELTRAVALRLPAGRHTVRLTEVTPLMDDARLTARCEGLAGATVEDVRVIRRWTNAALDDVDAQRRAALEAARQRALAEVESARQRLASAKHRRQAAERTLRRYLAQVSRAAWRGQTDWQTHLAPLEAAVEAADAALAAATEAHDLAQRAVEAFDGQLAPTAAAADRRLVADLEIRLTTPAAGDLQLVVSGVTPCALWRPSHQADLAADGTLTWRTLGTVWQRTGEAWAGVDLVLSTDRPAAGATLPTLTADRLRLQPKAQKKRVVLAHRQEAVSADQGGAAVPGVDDGGETRLLRAARPVDVPSDGRPHRVSAGGFTCDAPTRLLSRPDLAAHVFLAADLRNTGAEPILAGPVVLQREGAYVGTGDVAFVGAGERFELSFGSDDRFTVTYRRRRRTEARRLAKDRLHFTQEVDLQYAGAGRAEVAVELRMPVSELEALTVHPSKVDGSFNTEGQPQPDGDGRITLPVSVASGDLRSLSLGFWLERSGDVVLPDPW